MVATFMLHDMREDSKLVLTERQYPVCLYPHWTKMEARPRELC